MEQTQADSVSQLTRSDSPTNSPPPRKAPRKWLIPLAFPVVVGIIFGCCLRLASDLPVSSDGAANVLQAWAMLHGNVLLSGWRLSDVSFYVTELPEYMVVTAARGLRPDVVQICAAITYTLCTLLAVLVAKGGATGREGAVRVALAAGIALAPLASDQRTLLTSPDHTGTAVPILLLLLLLGRESLRSRMPVIAFIVLSAAVLSDQLTLVIGVAPLLVVWLLRRRLGSSVPGGRLERLLAVAACASALAGWGAAQVIKAVGGWRTAAIPATFVGFGSLAKNFRAAVQGLLTLFSVRFTPHLGWHTVLAVCCLTGLIFVLAAVLLGVRGIRAGTDLAASIMTAAIIADFAAYVLFIPAPQQNYREIDVIVPLGAALAGRMLTGPLIRMRRQWLIAVALAGYAIALASGLAQTAHPQANTGLGHWLTEHGLTSGIAEYWAADSLIADTGGAVQMAAVEPRGKRLYPNLWEVDTRWFNAGSSYADFMILSPPSGSDPHPVTEPEAVAALGAPWHVYSYGRYKIMVWQKNLLQIIR